MVEAIIMLGTMGTEGGWDKREGEEGVHWHRKGKRPKGALGGEGVSDSTKTMSSG